MARSLRIEVEGGWFHVTARGQNRERIFLDLVDAVNFADRLAEMPERFGVEIHGYVMMPNHYHVLVRTPRGGLSRAVQWLNTGYSIWWNNRHERVGHVFQGRFKSILIEEGQRLLELSLYLHFNPVAVDELGLGKEQRARAARGLDVADAALLERRLQTLRSWRWSSYRAMAGYDTAPAWLRCDETRQRAGGSPEAYRVLAETRLAALGGAVWGELHKGIILGSPVFAERAYTALQVHREHTHGPNGPGRITWPDVVAWVERCCALSWSDLCSQKRSWGRVLAWWAGRRWAGCTLRELGEAAGGVDYATVAKALERFPAYAERHPEAGQARDEITAWAHEQLGR